MMCAHLRMLCSLLDGQQLLLDLIELSLSALKVALSLMQLLRVALSLGAELSLQLSHLLASFCQLQYARFGGVTCQTYGTKSR